MARPRVAIIGAGLAGSVTAETLAAAGAAVSLFDMGRKAGRCRLMQRVFC